MCEIRLSRKLVLDDEQAGHLLCAHGAPWLESRLLIKPGAWYRKLKVERFLKKKIESQN